MAIDTALKRGSVQAYTFGLIRPFPDGSVGTVDRPVLAWLYAGLSYTPPILVVGATLFKGAIFRMRFWFRIRGPL